MFVIGIAYLALLYIGLFLIPLLILSFYYDKRDINQHNKQRSLVVFHCVKCENVYSLRGGSEMGNCPKCEFNNVRLKF